MDLIIYNKIIDVDVEDILDRLYLESKEKYLHTRQRKDEYISITCPFHKSGNESHPSCSVYNSTDNPDIAYGTYHCFTCGVSGPLYKLVAKVLNCSYEEAKNWLVTNFSSITSGRIESLDSFEEEKISKQYLDESILEQYKYLHPYHFKRKLSEDVIKRFKVGWDPKTDCITMPVWDDKGNLVGIIERSTKSKFYKIPEKMDKPIYLLNYVKENNYTEVVVCESQINTLTCWTWGIPAIGLIGTGSSEQYKILKHSGIRNYHLALDGDLAGEQGTRRFIKNMPKDVMIDVIPIPQGKDVNDLSKDEFLKYFNQRYLLE